MLVHHREMDKNATMCKDKKCLEIHFIKQQDTVLVLHALIICLQRDEWELLIKFITRVSLLNSFSRTRRFLGASSLPRMRSDDVIRL